MAWFHLHRHLQNAFIPHAGNNYHPHAVRHHMLGAYAVILILVKVASVLVVSLSSQTARVSQITPTNIIKLTNNERRAKKIPVLKSNTLLSRAAEAKANDMLRLQYFAHVSPTNITPWYWFKQAGYRYQYAGENLAIDFVESEDVVQAWMLSASHRKNILNTKFKEVGVAVVSGSFKSSNSIIVVQMFGTPPPAPVQRIAQAPAQQPAPTVVRQQLAQAAPIVLGETQEPEPPPPAPVAPAAPSIRTPEAGSVVRIPQPEIVGTAEAGSQVTLLIDDQSAGQAFVSAEGIYSLIPAQPLTEGEHTLRATATARGLTSPATSQLVRIDSLPPQVNTETSFALLSLTAPDTYDITVITSSDATDVQCSCGSVTTPLQQDGDAYHGVVTLDPNKTTSGVLRVTVNDPAGNETSVALADTNLFTTGVVASSGSPLTEGFQASAWSRTVLMTFLVLMLVIGLLNVVVQIEHQHHPTIVATLLVMYLAGSLMLL